MNNHLSEDIFENKLFLQIKNSNGIINISYLVITKCYGCFECENKKILRDLFWDLCFEGEEAEKAVFYPFKDKYSFVEEDLLKLEIGREFSKINESGENYTFFRLLDLSEYM